MKTKVTQTFFDFYALNLLDYFAGQRSLNHANRRNKISEEYIDTVDKFYTLVRENLEYAVAREFSHFLEFFYKWRVRGYKKNVLKTLLSEARLVSRHCLKWYNASYRKNYKRKNFSLSKEQVHLIHRVFNMVKGWENYYGGKPWAKAAAFLIQNPFTTLDKTLWIDKVLDLYHNCGPLLNKTEFSELSLKRFPSFKSPQRGRVYALNYRRYATKITQLSQFSSPKVKKLVTANLNQLPKIIR